MQYSADIWTTISSKSESFAQHLSTASYGFIIHGMYIFGFGMFLVKLLARSGLTQPIINWAVLFSVFFLGPKIPVFAPESTTLKVLLLIVGVAVIVLAPSRLSTYLSENAKQRRNIQIALVALLVLVFVIDLIIRRAQ